MLWIAVTADQYELPMIVEPTSVLLAKKLGVTPNSIQTNAKRNYNGKRTGYRIVKVKEM